MQASPLRPAFAQMLHNMTNALEGLPKVESDSGFTCITLTDTGLEARRVPRSELFVDNPEDNHGLIPSAREVMTRRALEHYRRTGQPVTLICGDQVVGRVPATRINSIHPDDE